MKRNLNPSRGWRTGEAFHLLFFPPPLPRVMTPLIPPTLFLQGAQPTECRRGRARAGDAREEEEEGSAGAGRTEGHGALGDEETEAESQKGGRGQEEEEDGVCG